MKEFEFKYQILSNYKITYHNIDMFTYFIEFKEKDIELVVTFNECDGKILPLIQIRDNIDFRLYYYQSFRKALNKIKSIFEKGGDNND